MSGISRGRSRTTKWNLFFHYVSIGLAITSGLLLVPLYLHYIPLNLYGAWLATGNILAWLTIVDPGLSTVLMQRVGVAFGKRDFDEINALLTGGLLLSGATAGLILVIGFILSNVLIETLKLGPAIDIELVKSAFELAVIGSSLMVFSYGLTAVNQGLQSSLGIGVVFVIATIAGLVLTVVLLVQDVGLLALPVGLILTGASLTIGNAAYLIRRYLTGRMKYAFSIRGTVELMRSSLYTFLGRSGQTISSSMDAFLLTRYLGPEIAPVYVLTRKAPELSRMFMERPAIAFMPAIAHLIGAGEMERAKAVLLRLVRMILWLLGLVVAGFLLLNRDFVTLWVGAGLFAGDTVNVIIVLTVAITVLVRALSSLCYAMGNIKGNSIVSLIEGLLVVGFMVVFARYWGMLGVALAPLVAMLCISIWYYPVIFSRQLMLGRAELMAILREGVAALFAAFLTSALLHWVSGASWMLFLCAMFALAFIYTLLLVCLSEAFREEAYAAVSILVSITLRRSRV